MGYICTCKGASVAWDVCCLPKPDRDLDIKHFHSFNKALLSKLAWKLMAHDFWSFQFLCDRYKGKDKTFVSSFL